MSDLQLDKKVVQDGRSETLKDVDTPLIDQIPKKLLEKCRELDLGKKVVDMWNKGNADRTPWLERQRVYLQNWDEFLNASANAPFEGSSNLHLPVTFIVAKTYHARMLQALLGMDPPFSLKAKNEAAVPRLQLVEGLTRYSLNEWGNHGEGMRPALDRWVWDWITTGLGLLKQRWDIEYSKFVDVQEYVKQDGQEYKQDEQGNEVILPKYVKSEREVTVTKKVYDGPVWDNVFPEDLLILGPDLNPNRADAVIHRENLTASKLWTLADRKIFDVDAVTRVIEKGEDRESSQLNNAIKLQRSFNSGYNSQNTSSDLDRYEILEAYIKTDVDGSGINSDIVLWVHPRSREILRATYLYRINKKGLRPFRKIEFHKRPGQQYPIGLVEVMYPLSIELDAIHNMRVDWGILSSMPYGFYKAASSIEPVTLQLKPGALIPLDNPQTDIYFPQMGNRTSFGYQEEAALQNMIERLTGISDLSLGVMTGAQGASRTATGAQALVQEASSNLDVHLQRLGIGWAEVLRYHWFDIRQRTPESLSFRITGEDGANYWGYIKEAKDLGDYDDYDFEFSANTSQSNPNVKMQTANQVLQITGNPLDIQLGIVTPSTRYESIKFFLQAYGIRDVSRFIQKPQNYTINLTPQEEVARVLGNQQVPVTPNSDHQGFLDYFDYIMKNDELLGQYSQQQILALVQHSKEHEKFAQAMQAQAAQQANIGQMNMNSMMGPQQAKNNGITMA